MFRSKLVTAFGSVLAMAAINSLLAGTPLPAMVGEATLQVPKPDQVRVELLSDALPKGAIARLGTVSYRSLARFGGDNFAVLPDSKTVVIGALQALAIQFMDATSGKTVREISTGNIAIHTITLASNGKTIAVRGSLPEKEDGTSPNVIGMLDIGSGKLVQVHEQKEREFGGGVTRITPNLKMVVSLSSQTGLLRVRDAVTGAELRQHQFQRGGGQPGLAISPDSSTLAVVLGPNTPNTPKLFLWKWQDVGEPREIKVPRVVGSHMAFSPDGKLLAAGAQPNDEAVRIWDVASGEPVQKLAAPDKDPLGPGAVTFTADGKTVIASFASCLQVWNLVTGKHQRRLNGPGGNVLATADSKLLVATGGGGFRAWDLETGKELSADADGHRNGVERIVARGNVVVTTDFQSIIVWDAPTAKSRFVLAHDGNAIRDIALSPDGTKLVSMGIFDWLCLWDLSNGKRIYKLAGHGKAGGRDAVRFTADGKYWLSYGMDNYLRKWDVATGKAVAEHVIQPQGVKLPDNAKGPQNPISLAAGRGKGVFSPDGNLFVLDARGEYHIFDAATCKELYWLIKDGGQGGSHAISPDGRLLLTNARGKSIVKTLPDGTMLGVLDDNHSICLWELATRQVRMKIPLPDKEIGPLAFSPDGRFFVTAALKHDSRVHIWDVATGKKTRIIDGYRGMVHSLAFTPDSQRLLTGMGDTTVLVWDLTGK